MATEMDNLTYETLGRLFAHLDAGGTLDLNRMREIQADYNAKKAAHAEAHKWDLTPGVSDD